MDNKPKCPECKHLMHKNGGRTRGRGDNRRRHQVWLCGKCGRILEEK